MDGGLNTYAYVDGNPLKFLDPLGLVTWKGSYVIYSGTLTAGWTWGRFTLYSECINETMWAVQVDASGFTLDIGAPISAFGGPIKFVDGLSEPDPEVFNGDFVYFGAGAAWGGGYGGAAIDLGGASSKGHGPTGGIDATLFAFIWGDATVESRTKIQCCN